MLGGQSIGGCLGGWGDGASSVRYLIFFSFLVLMADIYFHWGDWALGRTCRPYICSISSVYL